MTGLTLDKVSINDVGGGSAVGIELSGVDGLNINKCDIEGVGATAVVIGANCNNVSITDLTGRNVNTGNSGSNDFIRFASASSKVCSVGNVTLERQDYALERILELGSGWTITQVPGTSRRANCKLGVGATANIAGYTDTNYQRSTYV